MAGGELDEASTQQIAQRRGRGRALPPELSSRFGSTLGADVSAARIHDDAVAATLARRMSASAFTIGQDVFFSAGAYRPGDATGDQILAHELAHAMQNGPAGHDDASGTAEGAHRSVIRRAVGFEFETNIPVRKTTSAFLGLGSKKVPLKKMELIQGYPDKGLRMEADENSTLGSTIEFVVDPPVEEDRRSMLVRAMAEMVRIATKIDNTVATPESTQMKPANGIKQIENTVEREDVVVYPRTGEVDANPQATVGIAMNKVHEVSATLGQDDSRGGNAARRAMAKQDNTRIADAAGNEDELKPRPELRGLVTLLASYLRRGTKEVGGREPLNYAKLVSGSMMVRTDFGSYFNRLPAADKTWARSPAGAGDNFVDVVLRVARLSGRGSERVFERGVRKSNKRGKDQKMSRTKTDLRELRISRDDWLRGIAQGDDKLSAALAGQEAKDELEGLGRLGNRFDRVGGEVGTAVAGTGVIIELREMKERVPVGQWTNLALQTFDEIVTTNNT